MRVEWKGGFFCPDEPVLFGNVGLQVRGVALGCIGAMIRKSSLPSNLERKPGAGTPEIGVYENTGPLSAKP